MSCVDIFSTDELHGIIISKKNNIVSYFINRIETHNTKNLPLKDSAYMYTLPSMPMCAWIYMYAYACTIVYAYIHSCVLSIMSYCWMYMYSCRPTCI